VKNFAPEADRRLAHHETEAAHRLQHGAVDQDPIPRPAVAADIVEADLVLPEVVGATLETIITIGARTTTADLLPLVTDRLRMTIVEEGTEMTDTEMIEATVVLRQTTTMGRVVEVGTGRRPVVKFVVIAKDVAVTKAHPVFLSLCATCHTTPAPKTCNKRLDALA